MLYRVNSKIVGVSRDKIYRKTVKYSKHYFKKFSGWAIQKEIIEDLTAGGIESIEIKDKENHILYTISLKDFIKESYEVDFGHGEQLVCPEVNFIATKIE